MPEIRSDTLQGYASRIRVKDIRVKDSVRRTSIERGATVLTLGVVAKNPAIQLYERVGFVRKRRGDPCEECAEACTVFCMFGCPHYGFGGFTMEKPLS